MRKLSLLIVGTMACTVACALAGEPAHVRPAAKTEDAGKARQAEVDVSRLFTQEGTDPAFADIVRAGKLPQGRNSKEGVKGSTIHVSRSLVEVGPYAQRAIPKDILIHTLGNSVIHRDDFPKWTRWYQESGNTQVFRLFKGETNVRNDRPLAARVEAFSALHWKEGAWHEWSGAYTLIKPHGAAIFQAKDAGAAAWAVQIDMNNEGDIFYSPRHAERKRIAEKMTGKRFDLRVRDNGRDFEVYLDGRKVGAGSYARAEGETSFRWGMYLGEHPVEHDAMIFVTGAAFE